MVSSLKYADSKREEGFTLIELLVVVIIIGILAAIAIPVFLNQRQSAWLSAAESDARNAAIGVETYATQNNGDFPDDHAEFVAEVDYEESLDVTLTYAAIADGYTITADHDRLDDDVVYNSTQGGIQQ